MHYSLLNRDTALQQTDGALDPGDAAMSSEHQSDSEDGDESQVRPNSPVSDKEEDPDIDQDDSSPRIPPVPAISGEDGQERSAGSPRSVEGDPRSKSTKASRTEGTGGVGPVNGSGSSLFSWLRTRTIRRGLFVDPSRDNFRIMTNLYGSMSPAADSVNLSTQTHGAVFNLEYSPDG